MKHKWILTVLLFLYVPGYAAQDLIAPSKEEVLDLLSIQGKIHGEIIFQSRRTGQWHIMKMNADGTQLHSLTKGNSNNTEPQWNKDGTRIYFSSDRDGRWQIYTMNEDGQALQNISQIEQNEHLRGFSENESKVLFQTEELNTMDVYLRELPSRKVYKIDFSRFPGREGHISPTLSPNGEKIAFLYKGGRDARRGVYVATLIKSKSGYHIENAKYIHMGCFHVWSSDSERFIMCYFRPGGTNLYLIHLDGSEPTMLTNQARWNYFPAWGPQEWIAWSASPTASHDFTKGTYDIYIQNLRDKKSIRLTFDHGSDIAPSWKWKNRR